MSGDNYDTYVNSITRYCRGLHTSGRSQLCMLTGPVMSGRWTINSIVKTALPESQRQGENGIDTDNYIGTTTCPRWSHPMVDGNGGCATNAIH